MKIVRPILVLAVFLSAVTTLAVPAQAIPILWTLQGVTFSDQATASGSFIYNAATDTYSNWNISVTAGPSFTPYTYRPGVDSGFSGPHPGSLIDFVAFPPGTTGRYIRLAFFSPLTDAGGTIALQADQSYECNNCSILRAITGGSVTSVAAVPEPSTLVLLSSVALTGGLIRKLASRAIVLR